MRPVWGVAGLRMLRLANPLVRGVLESRAHALLSGRLVLLSYCGRRSGRTFRIPLRYAETEAGVVVAVAVRPERKQWWRTFVGGGSAVILVRGAQLGVRGTVAEGAARAAALQAYISRYPRSRRIARDAAVVVFEPGNG